MVVRLLQAAQFPGADDLVPYLVSPQDLMDFLITKKAVNIRHS